MTERSRPVAACSRYRVTDDGRVYSEHRGRFMAPVKHSAGYLTVCLSGYGAKRRWYIHRLVCEAFHGPPPFNGAQVAHIDGNPQNNAASNLRWTTQAENEADKARHGRTPRGEAHSQSKLTDSDIAEIKHRVAAGETQTAVRADYGISSGHISDIMTGKKWAEGESATRQGDAQ